LNTVHDIHEKPKNIPLFINCGKESTPFGRKILKLDQGRGYCGIRFIFQDLDPCNFF